METPSHVFSLSIDPVSKMHLTEAAKWARFLAIVGFIFLVLVVAAGIFAATTISGLEEEYSRQLGGYRNRGMGGYMGAGAAIFYVLLAVIYFFPLMFTLRFSNNMKAALAADNQERLNASFQNLKATLRYMGVITIIALVLIGISLAMGVLGYLATN